jgi:sodium/potassium-transporting ATPase subunit alpha
MLVICVLTDVFPALSLMLEKPEKDLLRRPPRSKKDHLVNWQLILQSFFFIGILQAFFSHFSFILYLQWYGKFTLKYNFFVFEDWKDVYKGYSKTQLDEFLHIGQTVTFSSLVIMQIFGHIFCVRTNHLSFFQTLPLFKKKSQNIWLFVAQFVALTLLILIIFLPFINDLFQTRIIPVEFFFIPLIYWHTSLHVFQIFYLNLNLFLS